MKKTFLNFLKYWLPVFIWASLIFGFSSIRSIKTSEIFWQDFIVKKLAHLTEYGILGILLYRGFRGYSQEPKKAAIFAIIFAGIYGISDELHQLFTPGREPTVRDAVIDTLGAALMVYLLINYLSKAPQKVQKLAKALELA